MAVAVEGEDEVQVLGVQRGGSGSSSSSSPACLVPLQRLHLPSVRYPCHVQYDPAGRLWLLGGAPIPNSLVSMSGRGEESRGDGLAKLWIRS